MVSDAERKGTEAETPENWRGLGVVDLFGNTLHLPRIPEFLVAHSRDSSPAALLPNVQNSLDQRDQGSIARERVVQEQRKAGPGDES
jgi:hypothetical protein